MKSITSIITMAIMAVCAIVANATEYTWTPTATGTYNWNDPANWGGGGYPNAPGDVAKLDNAITAQQTIQLREAITVAKIVVGNSGASGYSRQIANATSETFQLTLNSGDATTPAEIVFGTSPGTPQFRIQVPVTLASDLVVDMGGTSTTINQLLYFDNEVSLGTRTLTFVGGIFGANQIFFASGSEFSGSGPIINNSSATIQVTGKKAYGGRLILNGRASVSNTQTLSVIDGGFTNASEIVVNGYVTESIDVKGGGIQEGNGAAQATNPGQRFTHHRTTLNGGYFFKYGQAATVGTANDWQKGLEWDRDDIEVIDFKSGFTYFAGGAHVTTAGSVLNVDRIERSPGASAYLFGWNSTNVNLFVEEIDECLIGSEVNADTRRKIIPWMGVYGSGNSREPAGVATYDSATGLRLLGEADCATSVTAGADHNVRITADFTLAADATVNSLTHAAYATPNMGAGRTLTMGSGGLFFYRDNRGLGASGNAAAGTVNFGSVEGMISVIRVQTITIGAALAGSNGFSKLHTGTLTLTGDNSGMSGPVHVGGGTLRVGDGTYASNVGSGDVDVHAGAVLRISCDNAIANPATVRLYNLGPDFYFGKMEIDAGRNELIRFLFLGDEGMPAGTYGGTGSGADNILPDYFSGTGVLTVSSNAAALGETTLIVVK